MPDAAPLPGELAGLDVMAYMRDALVEAEAAGRAGEVPIGAVLVVDGVVVSRGRARRRATRSQLMHAEMQALLHGGDPLWERYDDAGLVTTLEPCPMCLGAIVMADVPHVVFALPDAVAGSQRLVDTVPYIRRHIRTPGRHPGGRSGCAVRALRSVRTRQNQGARKMSQLQESETNTRLGYPFDARLLIINADDFGMCHAINDAILRSLKDGVVCSTSVMVPCPWALHAMHLLAENPDIPFGIHLTVI